MHSLTGSLNFPEVYLFLNYLLGSVLYCVISNHPDTEALTYHRLTHPSSCNSLTMFFNL
uniref:Uncharacterized protein n=1 Tax=Sinocyclocheilus anshuiensis TaxID=1608454 RepID=A0A671M699_9TELE